MNIADIAKLAGVSNAAVSRYFNNGYISEAKREAIKKVVEETGYRPSLQAQTLRTKKTKMIGVIIPKIASQSIGGVVEGIQEVLNENNYQMLLANTSNNAKKELDYLSVFQDKHVDGVILLATAITPEHKKLLQAMKVPIVIIGQKVPGYCCVYHDDYHSMYDMAQLFLKRGCKKIGYICAPSYDKAVGVYRYEGVRDAIKESQAEDVELYKVMGEFNMQAGYEGAKKLLEQRDSIDGIICATDRMSLGALRYLHEHKYRIPEDVLLSGHGDSPYMGVTSPSITTVHFSYQESGYTGATILLEMIEKRNDVVKEIMMGYTVEEKESTNCR